MKANGQCRDGEGAQEKMNKYCRWGVSAASVFLVLCITGILFPMTFYMNDDVTMRSILSGTYTGIPDGHAVYMKYPLTGLISLLYRLFGKVPWFLFFMEGFFWLSVTMVLEQVIHIAERIGKAGIGVTACITFLCGALFLPHTVYLHYTIVAAVLGGCGLFLMVTGGGKKAILLFVLCYCVRSQMFFLLLPFLAVINIWLFLEIRSRQLLVMAATLAACILICMAWNGLMYRSEDWQQYEAYNESRTQLYDYHYILPYMENSDRYENAGIDEVEHMILDQYTLALEDKADAELLQAASKVYTDKLNEERNITEYLHLCLIEYYYHARYTDKPYNYILIGVYLLTAALMIGRRRWIKMLLLCCMAVGRSIIWLFLIWRGRFPERVYVSLYFLEIMVLAGMLCAMLTDKRRCNGSEETDNSLEDNQKKWKPAVMVGMCGLAAILLIGAGYVQMNETLDKVVVQEENQKEWDVLTEYCAGREDCFYLLDVMSMVSYAGRGWDPVSGKENYLLSGGWMSRTPLLRERLAAMGARDGGELLVKGEAEGTRIYYVAKSNRDISWLSEYLNSRFGEVTVVKTDSIMLGARELFCVYGVTYP